MRRIVALILMLIVPLQFAWAAAAGLHGHMADDVATAGMHQHGHAHPEQADAGQPPAGGLDTGHGDDGHPASHYHPVFSFILPDCNLPLAATTPGGPLRHPPAAFLSRVPPLLDRPPLAPA